MRVLPDGETHFLTLIWYPHSLNTYSTIALQLDSTAEDSRKHADIQFSRALSIMRIALLHFRQCLPRTSRIGSLFHRTFHASLPRAIVRPFLLSDIGEGENQLFVLYMLSLSCFRHPRGADHTVVRRTRGTCRAVRQDLRGSV